MNYSALKNVIKDKNFTLEQVAVGIGMSQRGFIAAMQNDSLRIRDLESIAKFLDVPLPSLLEGSKQSTVSGTNIQVNNGNNGLNYNKVSINECIEKVASLQKQIDLLQDNLKMKDKIIELLESK